MLSSITWKRWCLSGHSTGKPLFSSPPSTLYSLEGSHLTQPTLKRCAVMILLLKSSHKLFWILHRKSVFLPYLYIYSIMYLYVSAQTEGYLLHICIRTHCYFILLLTAFRMRTLAPVSLPYSPSLWVCFPHFLHGTTRHSRLIFIFPTLISQESRKGRGVTEKERKLILILVSTSTCFIHSFIQKSHLLCARNCSRPRGYSRQIGSHS